MPQPRLQDTARWSEFRSMMPVSQNLAYFDHAAVAPISLPAKEAIDRWSRQAMEEGDTPWLEWEQRVEQVRAVAAEMIAAEESEIALVPNTTAGINLVAEGFPWREGDNIVTLANEFPSNLFPWMNLASRGVETRKTPVDQGRVDLNRLAENCDDRTRIIAVSWVGYASGWRLDLAALAAMAHDRGALLFLDAIQGLGVFPLNVERTKIDFLAADGHKWMLGPEGAGLFYLRKEHLSLLRPFMVGWHSVVSAHDFDRGELQLRPTASRYEGGSQNMVGFAALGASLEMLAQFGLTSNHSLVAERVLEIADFAERRLMEMGAELLTGGSDNGRQDKHRSGIVTFRIPDVDSKGLRAECLQAGVAVSQRGGGVRISPHAYNNEEDVERLLAVIEKCSP